jgi:Sec-independent protein translocase protein TatA|tara:strand:+ start:260 stop:433 length:174 start_codon:yes stop_codon:yes gene_type:complete
MNIGLGQIIIIFLIIILLWGNAPQLISNVSKSLNDVLEMFKKNSEQDKETHDKDRKI